MGSDNRHNSNACECAAERGCKRAPRSRRGYTCEDEAHTLFPVSLEEIDVEEPGQTTGLDHTGENYHPRFIGTKMESHSSIW